MMGTGRSPIGLPEVQKCMADTTSSGPEKESGELRSSASDRLISIADIRALFKLGRTAAYELTHRPEFPDRVEISPRCYRSWASEVDEFAATLRRVRTQSRKRRGHEPHHCDPALPSRRITGRARAARGRKEAL
jgi:predicted DNA-binding transcriptional regulator AlpA